MEVELVPTPTPDLILRFLRSAADGVSSAQSDLDHARITYEKALTRLSIQALSVEIFPAKGEPGQFRAALNDRERELAIEDTCHKDDTFMDLRQKYELAQRRCRHAKDAQENARLIAQMMISRLE